MGRVVAALGGLAMMIAAYALARWAGNRMPSDHELRQAGPADIVRLMGRVVPVFLALVLFAGGIVVVAWNLFA